MESFAKRNLSWRFSRLGLEWFATKQIDQAKRREPPWEKIAMSRALAQQGPQPGRRRAAAR